MARVRRRRRQRPERKGRVETVGGFAFFSSYAMLLLLSVLNLSLLPALADDTSTSNWAFFAVGCFTGWWMAFVFVRGHTSVFLHEVRHAILSGIFGNRATGMVVERDSGRYDYEYTDKEYNAFIALAPYFLPMFTFLGGLFALAAGYGNREAAILIASMGYGADLVLNFRDISPRQTDISLITGGYLVGVGYIVAMNVTIFTFLAAWIFQGSLGVKFLFYGLWTIVLQIVAYYKGYPI